MEAAKQFDNLNIFTKLRKIINTLIFLPSFEYFYKSLNRLKNLEMGFTKQ